MRNLIIRRNKSIVGCAATLKVYISDSTASEVTIHKMPCRMLGYLKNGETAVFQIPESEARIYVIADTLSRNMDCEYCVLPVGSQDVCLSGGCRFDPFRGNPFHFDGNSQTAKQKHAVLKTVIAITALVALSGIFLLGSWLPGYIADKQRNQPKTFTADGMQITLTKAFQETDFSEYGFTLGYASNDTGIYILKEDFSLSEGFGDLAIEQYAQLVIDNNPMLGSGSPDQAQGLTIYEYTAINQKDGKTYAYLIVFLKGPDAFWMFEFATPENMAKQMRQTYLNYAATIWFPDAAI